MWIQERGDTTMGRVPLNGVFTNYTFSSLPLLYEKSQWVQYQRKWSIESLFSNPQFEPATTLCEDHEFEVTFTSYHEAAYLTKCILLTN